MNFKENYFLKIIKDFENEILCENCVTGPVLWFRSPEQDQHVLYVLSVKFRNKQTSFGVIQIKMEKI